MITRGEMEEVAEESADKVLKKLFLALGYDIADPKEIVALQNDLRHTRIWRESTETARSHALKTVIGALVLGGLGYIALLFRWHP